MFTCLLTNCHIEEQLILNILNLCSFKNNFIFHFYFEEKWEMGKYKYSEHEHKPFIYSCTSDSLLY